VTDLDRREGAFGRAVHAAGTVALWVVAVFWPWGLLQHLYLGATVAGLMAVVVLAAAVALARNISGLRVPWELFWPLALLGLLAAVVDHYGASIHYAAYLAVFAGGVLSFRQGRGTIAQCALLSAVSAAAAACYSIVREYLGGFPTAFSTETSAVLYFPATLLDGGFTLFFAGALGLAALCSPALHPVFRAISGVGAAVCLVAAGRIALWSQPAWEFPAQWFHGGPSPFAWAFAVLLVWFMARTAAKALVARTLDPPAGQAAFALPPLVLGAWCLLEGNPGIAPFLQLGLCAAYVSPKHGPKPAAWPFYAFVPLAAVLFVAVFFTVDRNQAVWNSLYRLDRHAIDNTFREIRSTRGDAAALAYLDRVDALAPRQDKTHALRIRHYLEGGYPDLAVMAFRRVVTTSIAVDPHLRTTVLQALRDRYSAQAPGARSLAYERALFIAGDSDNAVELLRARPRAAAPEHLHTDQLAAAVAWLAGVPGQAGAWRAWDRDLLFGILADAGAVPAPPGEDLIPEHALFVDVPAYTGTGQARVVFTAHGSEGRFLRDVPGPAAYRIHYTTEPLEGPETP